MVRKYTNLFDLRGQCVVLTGATGFLGTELAKAYAAHGANLFLIDLDQVRIDRAAEVLRRDYAVEADGIVCDLSKEDDILTTLDAAKFFSGTFHTIHNNAANQSAGLKDQFARFEDYDLADWRRVSSVDLDGFFLLLKHFGNVMVESKVQGSIIQTSSIYGSMGPDNRIYEGAVFNGRRICSPAVYSAVKAGGEGLVRWFATQFGGSGIRVNAIVPGGIESSQNAEFKHRYSMRIPLGRMAAVEDIVGAAVFLASDASRYVTGQCLYIDGGLSAW